MELSKFANAFVGKVVPSGSKVSGSNRPEIVLVSTYNKFVINAAGKQIMGLSDGDHIALIDMTQEATSMEDRFFVTKGYDTGRIDEAGNAVIEGGKVSSNGGFNYSKSWGVILSGDHTALQLSEADLVREQLVSKVGDEKPVALKKIHMKLEPVADGEAVPVAQDKDGEYIVQKVWQLTEFEEVAHTPRNLGGVELDEEI